jgi:TonB-linked SusC/RagA family outer membrane protein
MKVSCFLQATKPFLWLFFALLFQLSHRVHAQIVTYTGHHVPLVEVLQTIKLQTNYEVLGAKKILETARPISIKADKMPLKLFLDKILTTQEIGYTIESKTIFLEKKASTRKNEQKVRPTSEKSSQIQIRGQIFGKDRKPLYGVNITQGGNAIAVADKDGRFSIVGDMQPLTMSMVGYKNFILNLADNKGDYTIQMEEEANALDQVVVTGYQTLKKDSYTGTAITKSGEELRQVNPQNLLQAMQVFDPSFKILPNNLAGSNPNALPNINVRGSSALPSGSTDVLRRDNVTTTMNLPAFILDGFEVSLEKVMDLDMTRIESVTTLKDAAASAIYGSRAANGVMVIVTKAPKEGKLQVTYTHETNVNTPDLSGYNLLNATDKLAYEKLAGLYDGQKQRQSQDVLDELYYHKLANVLGGIDTYWLSQPVRTAIGQKHGVFLEGGAQTFRYGVDMRYQTRPGVMKGSGRNQYSGGLNFSYNPKNKIRFQNELSVTVVDGRESPYGSFENFVKMNPYYRLKDDQGNITQLSDRWIRVDPSGNRNEEYVLNPAYDATLSSYNKSGYTELLNNLSADVDLGKGLRLRGLLSLLKRMNTGDDFRSPLSNEFYSYETSRADERGSYGSYSNNELYWDGNIRLNWDRNIGKHYFNMIAGANIRTESYDERYFKAIGFPNDRFTDIGFAKGYEEGKSPETNVGASRLFGSFLSGNYSYDNRYLFDATLRIDGSSKFGANRRTAPFWSTGIGWNMHNEKWFATKVISQLRLRATVGLTGSVQFDPYMSRVTYSYDKNNWYSSGLGSTVRNYGNENLAWQRTQSVDLGVDVGFWSNRLTFSLRSYSKVTKDILADINIAPSTGFSSYKENLGDMENKGIEFGANWQAIKSEKWTLSLLANLVQNRNKIVRISNALKSYNERADEEQQKDEFKAVPLLRYEEGQSMDAIYAVPSLGVDPESGREVFVKRDGSLTYTWDPRDIAVVGVATPKMEGSFGGTLRYQQWMLVAYFQTRMGGKTYNQTLVDRVENADPRYNVDIRVLEERWKNPGDHTFFKSIEDLGRSELSSRFVMPDNLLTLQSLNISYDANKAFANRLALASLRVGLIGNDIFRWSNVKEERGINYPFARSVTLTLQARFK